MSITASRVREMIREEVDQFIAESSVDHDAIKTVVNTSIDLLKAIDSFESKSTEKQKETSAKLVDELRRVLEVMRDGAMSYIDTPKSVGKRVVFKKPVSG